MSANVRPIPADRPRLSPCITVDDCAAAIDFYRRAFGATEGSRMEEPNGRIGHAELRMVDAVLRLSDEYPEHGALSPKSIGGSPMLIHLYVEDAGAVVADAVEAGATAQGPVENHFYGDREGKLVDPFGHRWWIASRIEEVPEEEMVRRAKRVHGVS